MLLHPCLCELLLKQSLGLIHLIKTQLMFALMAPQRQQERQGQVILVSVEGFMAYRWRENSPAVQHCCSVGMALIRTQNIPNLILLVWKAFYVV